MKVKLTRWEKMNARKDVERASWFKFYNDFFEDDDFWPLTSDQKLIWIYVLMLRNKANRDAFNVEPDSVAEKLRVSVGVVLASLRYFHIVETIGLEITEDDQRPALGTEPVTELSEASRLQI